MGEGDIIQSHSHADFSSGTTSSSTSQLAVTRLTPVEREMVRLSAQGWRAPRIAKELGYAPETVRKRLRSHLAQEYRNLLEKGREERVKEYFDSLQEHVPEAIDTVVDVMRAGKDRERLAAAQDVIDRAGVPKISRLEGRPGDNVGQKFVFNIVAGSETERLLQQTIGAGRDGGEEIADIEWECVEPESSPTEDQDQDDDQQPRRFLR
jgi:hypothetical protein